MLRVQGLCRAAIASAVHGTSQVVAAMPTGWARIATWSRPTARCVSTATAGLRSEPSFFPAERASLIDNWHTIGLRGTASDGYSVNDLYVPEAYSTTREEPDLRRERGPLYAFTMPGLYAVGVAGVALGIARAMLEAFIDLAGSKAPRGQVRLADSATVQAEVARAEAKLGSASRLPAGYSLHHLCPSR
jgi:alkylation response protein AidB-like acyl-CoA dehydrogenase